MIFGEPNRTPGALPFQWCNCRAGPETSQSRTEPTGELRLPEQNATRQDESDRIPAPCQLPGTLDGVLGQTLPGVRDDSRGQPVPLPRRGENFRRQARDVRLAGGLRPRNQVVRPVEQQLPQNSPAQAGPLAMLI